MTVREGTTPQLVRALRAGTLDLALLAQSPPFRPPDGESPPLELTTLSERELLLAVPATHAFAGVGAVEVDALRGQVWVASRSDAGESLLGVWPGLPSGRTWATSCATGTPSSGSSPPASPSPRSPRCSPARSRGVSTVAVRGEPQAFRGLVLARGPGPLDGAVARLIDALLDRRSATESPPSACRWGAVTRAVSVVTRAHSACSAWCGRKRRGRASRVPRSERDRRVAGPAAQRTAGRSWSACRSSGVDAPRCLVDS